MIRTNKLLSLSTKLRYMLHVLLKHLLLLYLKKLIRINKLLSLSTEIYMHVACFVKIFIIILSKCMLHIILKHLLLDKNK